MLKNLNGLAEMPRIRLPLTRKSKNRDAKLIIIAAEGRNTEIKYFEDLSNEYYNPKVHVLPLKRESNKSAPNHVISQLNDFKSTYSLDKNDELWLVIDIDKWTNKMLSDIITQCNQKGYSYAVSNPCFELWLLLHILDVNFLDDGEKKKLSKISEISKKIRAILGSYNKSNIDTSCFLPHVKIAIERSKLLLNLQSSQRWTNELGTTLHNLVEKII